MFLWSHDAVSRHAVLNLAAFGGTLFDRIYRIYLSACDAQAGMIFIYPENPVHPV